MTVELRTPTDADWPAFCHADGYGFGVTYTPERIERIRPQYDLSRFRMVVEDGQIAAVAGSYAFDVTLPGGVCVPLGGVTWVATIPTHRGRGLMRQVVEAVHADIDARGEAVAGLYASQGGLYQRYGYGVASRRVDVTINRHLAQLRPEFRGCGGDVRIVSGDDVVAAIEPIWDRFRRLRSTEVSRPDWHLDFAAEQASPPEGGFSAPVYLVHPDGYAKYITKMDWGNGHPQHQLELIEIAAVTPDAHAALWSVLLGMDLIGTIHSSRLAIDDPVPSLLIDPREVRTDGNNDGVWFNVRDVSIAFGARCYRTEDRFVVEVEGKKWAIEGGLEGGSCRVVRTKADLVTDHGGLGSLLSGHGVPSAMAANRQMTTRNADVLRRADLFFPTSLAPNCQTGY